MHSIIRGRSANARPRICVEVSEVIHGDTGRRYGFGEGEGPGGCVEGSRGGTGVGAVRLLAHRRLQFQQCLGIGPQHMQQRIDAVAVGWIDALAQHYREDIGERVDRIGGGLLADRSSLGGGGGIAEQFGEFVHRHEFATAGFDGFGPGGFGLADNQGFDDVALVLGLGGEFFAGGFAAGGWRRVADQDDGAAGVAVGDSS